MKKIWKSVLRTMKNRNYQQKAIKYAEDMEKTEAVHRAPRHPTEQKYFQKVQADEKITQEIKRRNNILIDNMNKITVTSSEPESRWTTTKELQSKDTEWVHRNDQIWEFGFYEPPPEKVPKGKLMFREAIEILRTQCDRDFVLKLNEERRDILLPQILESLEKHPGMQRIGNESFNTIWQYFRPFERKEQQYVVKRKDIDELRDIMLGFDKERRVPSLESLKRKQEQELEDEFHFRLEEGLLDEGEKERMERLEKMKELKAKDDVRLSQELKKLGLVNENKEPDKAVKDDTEIRRLEQAK
ncbi:Uncharacterized protein BM_BM1696 [Brugia malayi]|uniref:Bm1696 n=1 Tax=Brugia malayi TaxID=6279 RepID=A0A0H5SB31_BRUMA|nr:Uncharacterized protein BM_BM1696 [Brugia malayi]CRZ25757.1 Bm1696 [Brugia malayi]VIO86149.1 Uncharacterized protein BM_BM1696 [Brugia malayi]